MANLINVQRKSLSRKIYKKRGEFRLPFLKFEIDENSLK